MNDSRKVPKGRGRRNIILGSLFLQKLGFLWCCMLLFCFFSLYYFNNYIVIILFTLFCSSSLPFLGIETIESLCIALPSRTLYPPRPERLSIASNCSHVHLVSPQKNMPTQKVKRRWDAGIYLPTYLLFLVLQAASYLSMGTLSGMNCSLWSF